MAAHNYNPPNPGPLNQTAQPAGVPQWVMPDLPTVANILGCSPDHGDHQYAWKILNLHSKNANEPARRPGPRQFREWCNDVLFHIWDGHPVPGSLDHRRAVEANRRVLSAMHTIAGIRRPGHADWKPNTVVHISPARVNPVNSYECDDFPVNLNGATWHHRVYVPATYDAFENHYSHERHRPTEENEPWMRRKWAPTPNMRADARERRDEDARANLACYGFRARPRFMYPDDKTDEEKETLTDQFYAFPVPRNEDSLWYSLSVILESTLHNSKDIKHRVAKWFDDVLTGPRQHWFLLHDHRRRRIRFRMYSQLLANSNESLQTRPEEDWGSLDLMRCLHRNARGSGRPMETRFHELLHLLADVFACEIITFTPGRDPPGLDTAETVADYLARNPYEMRVYGRQRPQADVTPMNEPNQILLATDRELRHFQPVTHRWPSNDDEIIDTDAFDPWDRHSPMPWWPGCQRNADDDGWTGDWDDPALRQSFTVAQRSMFDIDDISTMLFDMNGASVISPYWVYQVTPSGIEGTFYDGDADSDRSSLVVQNVAVRSGWTQSFPRMGPEDPPIRVARYWASSAGHVRDYRYRSDAHFKGLKRMADCHLEQYPNHEPSLFNGYLRVLATDVEDRTPYWHKRRRK